MFTQPSINQITSAYQGNPAPLARKVDQDKKQNGGIPKDLRQLMALNDIAQGKQNAGISQALQIPTNMPTVAQNTQQLAQQALQARMMQMAREQQRLQQKPPTVPFGTPQPELQPQGLDSLATNVGEAYAEGGIIGFDGTTGSDVKDPTEKNKSWIERFLYSNISPAERARKDALEAQAEAGRTVPTRINEERDRNMAIVNKPDPNKTQETFERLGMATRQEQPVQQVIGATPPAPPPPPKPQPSASQPRVNVDKAPMPAGLKDLAGIPSDTEALSMLKRDMRRNPETEAKALQDRFMKEVGSKDLSIYDKMAEELKARKERLNAPKSGYDATMELLEQIAQGGGRTWMEAGSRGVAGQRALQKARLSEQDVLMEKILDLGAKKAEAQYGEKKSMFDMTQKERDEVYKKAFDAAKSVNASDDEAKKIAAQAVENEKNRKNQIRAAQIGAQDRDQLMNRAKALMAVDKTLGLEEAMKRAALAAGASSVLSTESKDKAKGLEELRKLGADIPVAVRTGNSTFAKENRRQYEAGVAALEAKYGPLTSGLNALPTSAQGTGQVKFLGYEK